MNKRIVSIIAAGAILTVAVGAAIASESGNARKGKYVFRQTCRTCHAEGGKAVALGPDSKTQEQWKRVFTKFGDLKCKDEWNKISEQDRKDIYAYLYDHAADSPSPAKCK